MEGASLLIVTLTLLAASALAGQPCPEDWTVEMLLAHQNCDRFYKCTYGEPIVYECQSGLLFNSKTWQCDWPDNVDCSDRSPPGSVPDVPAPEESSPEVTEPEQPVPEIDAPECSEWDNGKVLAHEKCNQFYKCSYAVPVALYCPPGLMFNCKTLQCDWPDNVDCSDRSPPGSVPDVPAPEESSPEVPEPEQPVPEIDAPECSEWDNGKVLAHEKCNQFYKCSYAVPVALYCPPGLMFNSKTLQCDWPDNVDCSDRSPPGSVPDVPAPEESSPEVPEPEQPVPEIDAPECSEWDNGKVLAHEKCNQFYKCSYAVPVALYCPPGLMFNSKTLQCDWPDNVDCSDRSPPGSVPDVPAPEESSPEVPEPEEPAPEEPAPEINAQCSQRDDEELIAHENCNQFYQCVAGVPITQTCPSDLQFSVDTWACEWPEFVDCSNRNPPGAAPEQPEEAAPEEVEIEFGPSGCPLDHKIHWLVPHDDCNKFYNCIRGERVVASCPPQMAFNRDLQVCDHPEAARCVQRSSLNKHGEARRLRGGA